MGEIMKGYERGNLDNRTATVKCEICKRVGPANDAWITYWMDKENNHWYVLCPVNGSPFDCGKNGEAYFYVGEYLKDPEYVLEDLRQEEWFNEHEFNEMVERLHRCIDGKVNYAVEEAYEAAIEEHGGLNTENLERILSGCEEREIRRLGTELHIKIGKWKN